MKIFKKIRHFFKQKKCEKYNDVSFLKKNLKQNKQIVAYLEERIENEKAVIREVQNKGENAINSSIIAISGDVINYYKSYIEYIKSHGK
ncbi:MAG TPA: hypothetical protein PK495_08385 [Bacteroidales bacterium]|nr:hypothetical protein [Bacteroidales bacterium]